MNGDSNPPSIRGSKNVLYPDQITFSEKGSSTSQKFLIFLSVFLFLAASVFLGLFLVYYNKYEDRDRFTEKPGICTDASCITAASMVIHKMNRSVDPCEDFANFACGNFYKTATIGEGETSYNSFISVNNVNLQVMKTILQEEDKPGDWAYVSNMKKLYKTCMDTDKIEEVGVQPYLDTDYAKEWPTLIGQNWPGESSFNLNDVVTKYSAASVEPLFTASVGADIMNSTKNTLFLFDPNLGLPREYLVLRPRNDSVLLAYEHMLRDIAIELGANAEVAAADAEAVLDLEIQLSNITIPSEERRDISKMYNPTTLAAIGLNYSYVDIPRAFRAAFAVANMTLEDDLEVTVPFPSYFEELEGVIKNADKRALQNLFGFHMAKSKVYKLTEQLRKIGLEFDEVARGATEEPPRWKTCVNSASSVFELGMGKEYARRKFSEDSKKYMDVMIKQLKAAFKEQVQDASWMSEQTKEEAYAKLNVMGRKIGYPDTDFENEDIDKKYENLTMTEDNYYKNKETVFINNLKAILRKLTKPVDKNRWSMAAMDVNAYYSSSLNEIVFPAGILQPPFFSDIFPDAMNYGAIGVVIGHEITHGFDDQGSQFDKDGNLRNWWQPEDLVQFKSRGKCIVDQYANFRDEEAGMNVNGINTQGENIADNGGLKESFNAYKKLTEEQGDQKRIPGLDLTNDQIFFLGYAQLWCDMATRERKIMALTGGVHAPGRFRILGPLQNSVDFAEAYKCPKGSAMNPEKKCTVW